MRKLLGLVLHNLDLKIAALLLAAVAWYYVATGGLVERRFEAVPVRVVELPPDVAVLRIDVPEVSITLKGPRAQLDLLEGRDLVVAIELGEASVDRSAALDVSVRVGGPNTRIAAAGGRAARLSGNIRLLAAEPDAVTLTLNSVTAKDLPVKVRLTGDPAAGFQVRPSVVPEKVRVRGPARLMESLREIPTEPIPIDGLRESFRLRARLQQEVVLRGRGPVSIRSEPPTVNVALDVVEEPQERQLTVPVRWAGVSPGLAVLKQSVESVPVTLKGPERLLRQLDSQSLQAVLDLSGERPPPGPPQERQDYILPSDLRQVGASVALNPRIECEFDEEPVVKYTIDRVESREVAVRVIPDGAPAEGYELGEPTLVPPRVTVRGARSAIEKLDALPVIVPVAGEDHTVSRTRTLPTDVSLGELGTVEVEVMPSQVEIVLPVREQRLTKTLEALPVHVLVDPRAAEGKAIRCQPAEVGPVAFVGPASAMEEFGPDDVTAYVTVTLEEAGAEEPLEVQFRIAEPMVRRADGPPPTVRITVRAPARRPGP
ncbi:MAG: YbbR-like domain-containing protein [Candidatus Brocadiia bacterium]